MGKNETRRLNPSILAEDLELLANLKGMEDYAPANQSYTPRSARLILDV
jgi:hypothetical protein